jgi:hypothetical protein
VLSGLTVKDEEHPSGDIEIQVKGLRPQFVIARSLRRGDPAAELAQALDCHAPLAMTGWGRNDT